MKVNVKEIAYERWWNDKIDVVESDFEEFEHKFTLYEGKKYRGMEDKSGDPCVWGGIDQKGCVTIWNSAGEEIGFMPEELSQILRWWIERANQKEIPCK